MRKPADLSEADAFETIAAPDLYALYSKYEDSANKKYLSKVIEVKGTVVEIDNQPDSLITILLGDPLQSGRVSCLLDNKQTAAATKILRGDFVKVKGICTGFLMDVELNRCVLVK